MPTTISIIDEDITIPSGTHHLPGRAIPTGIDGIRVTAARNNWPVAGVTIRLQLTYAVEVKGVQPGDWVTEYDQLFPAGSVNPKTGVIPPVDFSYGWGRDPQPKRARLEATSPSNFVSHVTVEAIRNDASALKK